MSDENETEEVEETSEADEADEAEGADEAEEADDDDDVDEAEEAGRADKQEDETAPTASDESFTMLTYDEPAFSCLDFMMKIYQTKYYWDLLKSTVVFMFALKLARECNMMAIPMREYRPFHRRW